MPGLSHDGPELTGPGIETTVCTCRCRMQRRLRLNAALYPPWRRSLFLDLRPRSSRRCHAPHTLRRMPDVCRCQRRGRGRSPPHMNGWPRRDAATGPLPPAHHRADCRAAEPSPWTRVMSEGSLYDSELAALAVKQARGDLIEAIFLIRAYRTTLPRLGSSRPHRYRRDDLRAPRLGHVQGHFRAVRYWGRPSTTRTGWSISRWPPRGMKPLPRGMAQLCAEKPAPRVSEHLLDSEGLLPRRSRATTTRRQDLTRAPLELPAERPLRLQALARADEGFLLGLAFSTQRGYGRTHAFVGELRIGAVEVDGSKSPSLGFAIDFAEIVVTECGP